MKRRFLKITCLVLAFYLFIHISLSKEAKIKEKEKSLIVVFKGSLENYKARIEKAGGRILKELKSINGASVKIKEKDIPKLSEIP
ncbi:MAG: hypothetical protein DRP00_02155, partial [Candidatus Aenigmatarchaeota archaeon]